MHQYTAAEALALTEALRGAAAAARAASMELARCQDPDLRQLLQSEVRRHQQGVQKIRQLIGGTAH